MTTTDRTPLPADAATTGRWRRRLASGSGVLLVAALLPLLGAPPAQAAECTSEVAPTAGPLPIPIGPGCDDPEPPDTTIDGVTPVPNANDWIQQKQVSFTFHGTYADADADPITYECQFYSGATPPAEWTTCTSPASYDALTETPSTSYTFKVRAVDSGDHAIDLTAALLFPQETDLPDFDQTPAETTVRVDTVDPIAVLTGGPYDASGAGMPIAKQPRVTYFLDANEPNVDYTCHLDGQPIACVEGQNALKNLEGGTRTFSVAVEDQAGNAGGDPETRNFVMPFDLTKNEDWKPVKSKRAFAHDVLQAKHPGDRLRFRVRNVRALTLLAPSGPGLGKIQVRVGNGVWHVIDLSRKKASPRRSYVLRTSSAPLVSGSVLIESLSTKPVQVDALVLPPE